MIHIGSAGFYSQVRDRLGACDAILFEGVRSLRGWVLTLSYRLVVRRKRLNLVLQSAALPLKDLGARLIHADVGPGEFNDNWARIPWHWRVTIAVCAPIFGAYQYLVTTRESIGRRISTEDIKSREDVLLEEKHAAFKEAILDRRDAKLAAAIEAVLADAGDAGAVGVVYGAGHMSAVTGLLISKHRFRVVHAEWLTVFDYADV
jgi:hypothetical protein